MRILKTVFDRPYWGSCLSFYLDFYIYSNADRQSLDRMPDYVMMTIVKMFVFPIHKFVKLIFMHIFVQLKTLTMIVTLKRSIYESCL